MRKEIYSTNKKITSYRALPGLRRLADKSGRKIVFTSGCYDILHLGHVKHFEFCKKWGDVLVVSVGNDATVSALKGQHRPIVKEKERLQMVAALCAVDYVVLSRESGIMDHVRLMELLRPDVYVISRGDKSENEKRNLARSVGAKLVIDKAERFLTRSGKELSTTSIESELIS